MARRMDWGKAGNAQRMTVRGAEPIEGVSAAEEARKDYRGVLNERVEEHHPATGASSHERIVQEAQTRLEADRNGPWRIVQVSAEFRERAARKLRNRRRRLAKREAELDPPAR